MTNLDPNQVPPTTAPVPTQPADSVHRAPDDQEEVYYEGSPLLRGALGRGFLWILGGVLLIAAAIAIPFLKGQRHYVPWWVYLALVVIGLILIFVPLVQSKTVRYRITNYRIDYERGIFGKDIDTLELWHVEDIRFHQTLLDRILGVGNITVISHDQTMPMLMMRDIPHSRPLFEQMKQRIIAVKRSRGVLKMDPG
ncbi:MAG TPA: PH domain-containing protein [Tepidisphaeraceae bacterium]|nr:PH domain-containing protein [Tepidisphaeraceae bacterium]